MNLNTASMRALIKSLISIGSLLGALLVPWSISQAASRGAVAGPWESTEVKRTDATDDGFSVDVYRNIVRSRVLNAFDALNRQDAQPALQLMSDDVRYTFEGQHALGGTRQSRAGVERWFKRLFSLLPSRFTLRSVEVAGWPWRSTAYVVFEDAVTPVVGEPYRNQGVQVIELEWGKAVAIHTYVDTAKIEHALKRLADAGVGEATASPITD